MAKDSDQPSTYTMEQMSAIYDHDAYSMMRIRKAPKGSRIMVPLNGETETVTYVYGGLDYWHREDTKGAEVAEKEMERQGVEVYTHERDEKEPLRTRLYRRRERIKFVLALTWDLRKWNPLAWRRSVKRVLAAESQLAEITDDAMGAIEADHRG